MSTSRTGNSGPAEPDGGVRSRLGAALDWMGRRRNARRIAAAVCVLLLCLLYAFLKPHTWAYYTDGIAIRRPARSLRPRLVMWERPQPVAADFAASSNSFQAGVSDDGTTMVISRGSGHGDADLFVSRMDGGRWSDPEPLLFVNSKNDDVDPALSADGRYLFFASDRPGGLGGLDVWMARWNGRTWIHPVNLGETVNSRFNDCGPAAAGRADRLFFASSRPRRALAPAEQAMSPAELGKLFGAADYDIFLSACVGETNVEGIASFLLREPERRTEDVLQKLGASAETEAAVERALAWLSSAQRPDGSWSFASHGGLAGNDTAATALSLLSFYGWGATHDKPGKYQETVSKGIQWLVSAVKPDGDARGGAQMYAHGMASIALCEAFALTKDERLREPAQKALDFIVAAQNKTTGGWRYTPGEAGDTSVVGWQIMALRSGIMAGLKVPDSTLELAGRWLTSVGGGSKGGLYGYAGPGASSPAMVAEGMFCRQLLGALSDEPRMVESAQYTVGQLPSPASANLYHWYYGSLAMYHHQGAEWEKWNDSLKKSLLAMQKADAPNAGCWPATGVYGDSLGMIGVTALSTLSLEVYYRYLPLYGFSGLPARPSAKEIDRRSPQEALADQVASATASNLPPILLFGDAGRLDAVNSPAQDMRPATTRRGDFLYFESDCAGGRGGRDLYRSRYLDDRYAPPENVADVINSAGDDKAPTLCYEGFKLFFVSNGRPDDAGRYRLYETMSREVVRRYDLSRLYELANLLKRLKWIILGLMAALIALYYLLKTFADPHAWKKRSLFFKCLVVSALFHLIALVIAAFWVISAQMKEAMESQGMEVSVDFDALAKERLSLEMSEDVAQLPRTPDMLLTQRQVEVLPVPELDPEDRIFEPIVKQLSAQSFVVDVERPAEPVRKQEIKTRVDADKLPELQAPSAAIVLEERKMEKPAATAALEEKIVAVSGSDAAQARPIEQAPPSAPAVSIRMEKIVADALKGDAISALSGAATPREAGTIEELASLQGLVATNIPAMRLRAEVAMESPKAGGAARPRAADVEVAAGAPSGAARTGLEVTVVGAATQAGREGAVRPSEAAGDTPARGASAVGAAAGSAAESAARNDLKAGPGPAAFPPGADMPGFATVAMESGGPRAGSGVAEDATGPSLSSAAGIKSGRGEGGPVPGGDPMSVPGRMAAGPPRGQKDLTAIGPAGAAESSSPAPRLHGVGSTVTLRIPSLGMGSMVRLDAPDSFGMPKGTQQVAIVYYLRDPVLRGEKLLDGIGGSSETEGAVTRALDWFSKHQEPDGRWDIGKYGGEAGNDVASTAFALLCYYGWGAKHTQAGPYRSTVSTGLAWLVSQVAETGAIGPSNGRHMYNQGLGTMALTEAYGITKDQALLKRAKAAAEYIIRAQNKDSGGWRYQPGEQGDTSVFGWQVMALKSGEMSGLAVPQETWDRAAKWLDTVGGGANGGLYGYADRNASVTMSAEAMFSRQLLGMSRELPRMTETAAYIHTSLPSHAAPNFYFWYYGTLSLYQHQGPEWEDWNREMKKVFLAGQVTQGDNAGSWEPAGTHGGSMGRVIVTAMATLSLEVYYRYLPLYGFGSKPAGSSVTNTPAAKTGGSGAR